MRSLAGAVLLLVLALSGCGGAESPSLDVPALVARTISASEEAESYRVSTTMKSNLGGKQVLMKADGVSAADQTRGRYDALYVEDGERIRMDMIVAEGALYFRGKDFADQLPPGKTWLRMPDDTPSTMTPAEFVEFLREADDIEDAGREEVRGIPSIHLSGPLDIGELLADTSSEAADYFDRIPGAERLDATIDAWISEKDDRITRIALEMTVPGTSGSMSMAGDVLEYDVPLDGTEPPDPATVHEDDG